MSYVRTGQNISKSKMYFIITVLTLILVMHMHVDFAVHVKE